MKEESSAPPASWLIGMRYEPSGKLPRRKRVLFGLLASQVITVLLHPLDRIKARMQVHPKGLTTKTMADEIIRCEGYYGFYRGLSAALMRQATYTTTRVGAYHWLYDHFKMTNGRIPSVKDKVRIGVAAGLLGGVVGNPADMALLRMMTSSIPSPNCPCTCLHLQGIQEVPYRNVVQAWIRIIREEGVFTLWRGTTLTLSRSVVVSVFQIGTHSSVREHLKKSPANDHIVNKYRLALYVVTNMASTLMAAVLSLPIDTLKSRFQMETGETIAEVTKELTKTGALNLWRGFLPYYVRMVLHASATSVVLDYINHVYHSM